MRELVPAKLLAALNSEAVARLELPGDALRESRRRLRIAAACGAVAYAVFLVFGLSALAEPSAFERSMNLTSNLVGLWLCVSVLALTLIPQLQDRAVLRIALVAQVLLCGLISVEAPWVAFAQTAHVPALTWVVPVIILFPLLVPAPPRTALFVSFFAALTVPGGLWFLDANDLIEVTAADHWRSGVAVGIAVAIANVGSRTIYGAGRQLAAARRVGSYELLEALGRGGMGEVWKARHSLLARPAAVKLILPQALQGPSEKQDAAIQRFRREAQATAGLRSPHTVDLYDFGMTSEGTLYYAMELLDGVNMEHFVYQFGPVEPCRAVHWLQQACHSLGEAHAQGLVHRDIKPANIFLCQYGRDADFIKILDFGLAKPPPAAADAGLTAPGTSLGTPGYMAPEQVFGLDTDARTDLYALGCVGYWLIAGKKPFEADSPGELLRQHAQDAPPRLSQVAPHPVPERLAAVLLSCLAKNPNERPASADRLGEELGRSVEGPLWTAEQAQAWWDENRHKL